MTQSCYFSCPKAMSELNFWVIRLMYDTYVKRAYVRKVRRFWQKFQVPAVLNRKIYSSTNKFRLTETLMDKKNWHWVVTKEKLDVMGARPECLPHKSFRCLAEETRFNVSGFMYQVCSVSKKELQHVKVNILRTCRCKECVLKNRGHTRYNLWSGCALFVICRLMGLSIALQGPNTCRKSWSKELIPLLLARTND
jgi:hypothetical protein